MDMLEVEKVKMNGLLVMLKDKSYNVNDFIKACIIYLSSKGDKVTAEEDRVIKHLLECQYQLQLQDSKGKDGEVPFFM